MTLSPFLKKEIPVFETFFYNLGFKRTDGAIFAVLVLSEIPLSSYEIENELQLSQSAVSLGLKKLSEYGAIETWEIKEEKQKRTKVHTAKDDGISIVSNLFRKREMEMVEEFEAMAERILQAHETKAQKLLIKRMDSILLTCQLAKTIIEFVFKLGQTRNSLIYHEVGKNLGKSLDLLLRTSQSLKGLKDHFGHYWRNKWNKQESSLQE